MLSEALDHALESATVSLNRLLWDEGVGLPVVPAAYDGPSAALAELLAPLLDSPDPLLRAFAVEGWAEARRVPLDAHVTAAMDEHLVLPHLAAPDGPLTWRNWKAYERAAPDARSLETAFSGLLAQSERLVPALTERVSHLRADFGRHALTPVHIWALREGTTPEAVRALLRRVGAACRVHFAAALDELSHAVFGRPAGPAELRALYLNRMYEPHNGLFIASDPVLAVQRAFDRLGFSLDHIRVDTTDRPRKYPGAFCFPIRIPGDVRVSVRVASPHHLVDMLYHEFGHAIHFSGIRADLPFVDRYWLTSGAHETFSTLFEQLLAEPRFLRESLRLDSAAIAQLTSFARFKALLAGTWLGAAALTACDAWLDDLSWPAVEARFAGHMLAFTGVALPPAFARLEGFTPSLSVYPAGYVLAHVRVANWLEHLRALGGEAWWHSPDAQADIRSRVSLGGAVSFPPAWNNPAAFLAYAAGPQPETAGASSA